MIWIVSVLAITLFTDHFGANAQAPARTPLDPAVIEAVDPLYPGFVEIVERDDTVGLVKLAQVLSDHPSPDSLAVLLWMLRYCPSWPNTSVVQIDKTIRAVGRLPLGPVIDTLQHANADQRLIAAALIGSHQSLIPDNDKPLLDRTLVAAVNDRSDRVRDMVVAALRARDSAEAGTAVREFLAKRQGSQPKQLAQPLDAARFPRDTIALLESLDPGFRATLTTLNEAGVRRLLAALQRSPTRAGTPVLLWLLANGDTRAYAGNVVHQLSLQGHAMQLPFGELAEMLRNAEPERKALIADLFARVFAYRTLATSQADRDRVVATLIECLSISHDALRNHAVEALGRLRAAQAIGPIVRLLDEPDSAVYHMAAIRALAAIATRETLPTLERLARSGGSQAIREAAASAYITVAKPANPGADLRRLLWEPPDTALEKRVQAEGKTALPAVWQALTAGTADERRAAAALLGWFRDTRSIAPILAAIDAAPGALTREQLLFDLNMILLTEAPEVDRDDRNSLATLHLQWLHDELSTQPVYSAIREPLLAQTIIHVFPDRITVPFASTLGGTTALSSASPEAFLDAMRKAGSGVVFHAMTAANGVARVASTLYLKGQIANQVWISLYRRDGDRWVPLRAPTSPPPMLNAMLGQPSLMPTINRNYGAQHPLKILRLDFTMERIRVDLNAREYLRSENRDNPIGGGELDATYVSLLDRYKNSASTSVKYAAEFESARLTKQPNLDLWIDALLTQSGTPIQQLALEVLGTYVAPRFKTEGRELAGAQRRALVAAALAPLPADPRLVPSLVPRVNHITTAQQWTRFGLVTVATGSSGYSMLFDRRGERWVFLCVVLGWIS